MNQANELKPCPFCGSHDIKVFTKHDAYYSGWHMHCMTCGIDGPDNGIREPDEGKSKAAKEWNRREGA